MLTQGPSPDPKCKLNITSFLKLPHPLDCRIYAKDIMITVLLLQMMGDEKDWGWFIYVRLWVREKWVGIIFFLFLAVFLCCCELYFHGVVVCFIVPFLLSLPLVPLIRQY